MIRVVCSHCQTKYRFDEAQLGGKSRVKATCKKCGERIEIDISESTVVPGASDAPAAVPPVPDPAATPPPSSVSAPASAAAAGTLEEMSGQLSTARVKRLRSDEPVGEQTMTGPAVADLQLPTDKKYSLAVLQGKASGQIFEIQKVRTVLGRADCDVVLDDPEASRQHASIEILGSRVIVADLKSTNGTFVDGEQMDKAELQNHSEFRIGEHVLMLIVTDRE